MKILNLGLGAFLTASVLYAGSYNLDVVHTSVAFKIKHMMISNVKGHFVKFIGTFEYDDKTKQVISLNGDVKVSSISTGSEKRDADLKSANFFDAKKYPNINFNLTKVIGDKAYGKLTMHGITKDIVLNFENNGMLKDPWGNTRVGLALNGKINRKDFGLTYNTVLEAGGVLIGEVVKLDIEIEGILTK